ncbi:hypothetical protein AX17_003851 [Amanita inopinata Kibby_2008]|nr:hypothetical protein AX17_003851 [Amanita inopinata Kibby_2008]
MNASRLMACTLLSLFTSVSARPVLSHLSPQRISIDKADLAFLIIFAIINFLLLCHAAFALFYKRTPDQDYRFRVPFVLIMVLTLLTSIVAFVIGAIVESRVESNSVFSPGTYAALNFTEQVTPIYLYTGLFLLLVYRRSAQILPGTGQVAGFTAFGLIEGVVVGVLLLFMLASAIARSAIFGMPPHKITPDLIILSDNLYHPFLAASIVITFIIGFDSIFLWKNRDEASSPRHLYLFDNNVLLPMAAVIGPLLIVRILFDLAYDVVLSRYVAQIDSYGIALASLLINGSTQLVVIALALMFGFPLFGRKIVHGKEGRAA